MSQLAQLRERLPQALLGGAERAIELGALDAELAPRQANRDRKRGQALLGPVVKVALE